MNDSIPPGERMKREALDNHEANNQRILWQARRRLLVHLLDHGSGTIDDARRDLDLAGANPSLLGAVPGPLAHAQIIMEDGYTKSARQENHARRIIVWKLANPEAARAWLAAHPEPPDPSPPTLAPANAMHPAPDVAQGELFLTDDRHASGGHCDA